MKLFFKKLKHFQAWLLLLHIQSININQYFMNYSSLYSSLLSEISLVIFLRFISLVLGQSIFRFAKLKVHMTRKGKESTGEVSATVIMIS